MKKLLPMALLLLPIKALATTHPRLLCTRSNYATIIASSTVHPWSDVIAGATNYLAVDKSEPYPFHPFGTGSDAQRQENENQMENLFGTYALLYVINTNNSGSITYRNKITSLMDQWPATRADQPIADGYNVNVPMNGAFMSMTIAFDLIYDDLSAVTQSSYTVMMDSWIAYSRGVPSSWALSNKGTYLTYSIFRDTSPAQLAEDLLCYRANLLGNTTIYPPAICGARQTYYGLSSEISNAQLNVDGVHGSGSSYAWARLGGSSREKEGKWGGLLVAGLSGVDTSFFTDSRIKNFYEWLFVAQTSPWNTKVPFGDTANNQSVGEDFFKSLATIFTNGFFMVNNGYLTAGRYSEKARQLANRSLAVSTVTLVYPGEFIDYVAIMSSDTTTHAPESTVVTHGGAAFWSSDTSTQALQGVLDNHHVTKDDHYHHADWNGLYLAGYGETLLSNTGIGATGTTGSILGFPPQFYRRNAHAGSVALIGNRNYAQDLGNDYDNSYFNWNPFVTGNPPGGMYVGNPTTVPLYGGDGIEESILSPGQFDYAVGIATSPYVFRSTTTGAVLYTMGSNERTFIFVHPDTSAVNANGYWIVADDMVVSTATTVNVLWHPYGSTVSTTTANTEWDWLVSTRAGVTSTHLNVFSGTTPSAVSFSSSPFSATPNDFVGSYLNATYNVDSSSNARIVTVLYPSNPTHTKATMGRYNPTGATGVFMTNGTAVDSILISSPSSTVTIGLGSYKGRIGYTHVVSGSLSSFFVRQGTSFSDGGNKGFTADNPTSIYMKGLTGNIVTLSPATSVTISYPNITGIQLNGAVVAGTVGSGSYTISIASGSYTVALATGSSVRGPSDSLPAGFRMFPANNIWNTRIDNASISSSSTLWMDTINGHAGSNLYPNFGTTSGGNYKGIPYNIVYATTPHITVPLTTYATESDTPPASGVPVPTDGIVEGDPEKAVAGSRHMILVDVSSNIVYEMLGSSRTGAGTWEAKQLSVWYSSSNILRTTAWNSADSAGLPILPGLVRYDEVQSGAITHALRFTLSETHGPYLWPARHDANTGGALTPPFGMRVRLKASVDISFASAQNQVIFQAMKTYGMFLADNGGDWYVSGSPNAAWDDASLQSDFTALGLPKDIFDVVDESTWIVDSNSGEASIPSSLNTLSALKGTARLTGSGKLR